MVHYTIIEFHEFSFNQKSWITDGRFQTGMKFFSQQMNFNNTNNKYDCEIHNGGSTIYL